MKLLHVIASMNPKGGGVSQGIRNLSTYNTSLGVVATVVTMDDITDDYGITDPFPIHKLGKGKTSFQYNPSLYNWLLENCLQFDHIVVHGIWQYQNYAVFSAIKKLKKIHDKLPKVVVMPHGMLDPYFQKAGSRKWKALRNEIVWKLTENRAINAADALFFTCEEELLLARTTFKGYKPKKELNVGFGIQRPPQFNLSMKAAFEKSCPQIKNKEYWLFISRIHPKKGIDVLIDAYIKVAQENTNVPDLVIAGPIDTAYAEEMVIKAKSNPKIHFSGMITSDSKWGAFYGCEAYVLPSHQENFGIAIVEAMACSKPVLISKNINIWREIDLGNGGWILDSVSVQNIEEQLRAIASQDGKSLVVKGKAAFETYANTFDVAVCSKQFVQTLKRL